MRQALVPLIRAGKNIKSKLQGEIIGRALRPLNERERLLARPIFMEPMPLLFASKQRELLETMDVYFGNLGLKLLGKFQPCSLSIIINKRWLGKTDLRFTLIHEAMHHIEEMLKRREELVPIVPVPRISLPSNLGTLKGRISSRIGDVLYILKKGEALATATELSLKNPELLVAFSSLGQNRLNKEPLVVIGDFMGWPLSQLTLNQPLVNSYQKTLEQELRKVL